MKRLRTYKPLLMVATLIILVLQPYGSIKAGEMPQTMRFMLPYCDAVLIPKTVDTDPDNWVTPGMCLGAAAGVLGAISALQQHEIITPCIKEFISNGQVVQVFINWARNHPRRWNNHFGQEMFAAFFAEWNCKLKK